MIILVTGGVGFIGSALAKKLYEEGNKVVVLDNFNEYYDVTLKRARQKALLDGIEVVEGDITDEPFLKELFSTHKFDLVCHLAAQAGVRYSVECPEVYIQTNVQGTQFLFEKMKEFNVRRMVFASTSSVYGVDTPVPFNEDAIADKPVSIYSATKRSCELIAHTYFSLYRIETTCLRFFTVFGPWSRPDMAMYKFASLMKAGKPIDVYNNGDLRRDFTYIEDIVEGFVLAVNKPLGYEILNLGRGEPTELIAYIKLLEHEIGVEAHKNMLPMQAGDVYETYANTEKALKLLNFKAKTDLQTGIKEFVSWYNSFLQK